ncbi:DnaD domain protein [Streptococcus suis]|nr:DnaD domain protein [Streptococcus suis]
MMEKTATFFKNEVEKFQYFQFPKWLLKDPYCNLSLQAKMIYTLMYDRIGLSLKNEWFDDNGKIYIYYSNESLASKEEGIDCSIPTVIKAKKELANMGLLSEVRQGLTLSNRIYLKGPNSLSHEVKNFKHRTKDSLVQDDKNFKTNKTEYNKTEDSNSNSSCINKYDLQNLFKDFEKGLGRFLSPFEIEDIEKWVNEDHFDESVIREALREAVLNGKVFMKYINGILRNWKKQGLLTVEAVKAHQAERQQELPKNVDVSSEFLEAMNLWKD